jgi:hypothetical protein
MTPGELVVLDFGTLSAVWAQGFVAGCSSVLLAIPVRMVIRAVRL